MGKSISLNYKAETKNNIAVVCALAMLVGFLLSRAVLSVSIIAFGINALIGVHPKHWVKNKWWLLGVAWVAIYFISGLWTANFSEWNERVSVKLPVLLLPLAFGLLSPFTEKQLRVFTVGGALLFLASTCYSLSFLFADPDYYIEQYRFSKVMPTLANHDYIRYSLSISLFVIWCFYFLPHIANKAAKWLVRITVAILCIYIHIVAVKTGILVLYLFVSIWAIYIAFKRKLVTGLGIMLFIVLAAVSAYKYVPTFQQKVDYFRYSWKVFSEGRYDSDYSDIGRLVSYDVALKMLPAYAVYGTGIGDMHDAMRSGYRAYYPYVADDLQLKPHNQFLIVALGCGIPAMLLFLVWVCYPLKLVSKTRDGFFLFAVWFVMLVPLMVEPFLELQLGVYVYLFFLLWMMRAVQSSKGIEYT